MKPNCDYKMNRCDYKMNRCDYKINRRDHKTNCSRERCSNLLRSSLFKWGGVPASLAAKG